MKLESIETSIPPLKQQRLLPNLLTDEESEEEINLYEQDISNNARITGTVGRVDTDHRYNQLFNNIGFIFYSHF